MQTMMGIHAGVAWYNTGASGLALTMEIIRVYQEITRLNDRYHAYMRAQVSEYDAAYTSGCLYIPGTDIPLHTGAVAFTPWWRIMTCIILAIFFVASIPNWKYVTYAWGPFFIILNRNVAVWYQGALEFYIGLMWLGSLVVMPLGPKTGHVSDGSLVWCRYVSAWLLLGAGLDNLVLGVMFGPGLRVLRGQSFPDYMAPGASPGGRARMVWPQIRQQMMTMGPQMMMGPAGVRLKVKPVPAIHSAYRP